MSKISFFVIWLIAGLFLATSCDDEDKLTGSPGTGNIQDISSSSDLALAREIEGAGFAMEFTGSDLEGIMHVIVDDVVRASDLNVSDGQGSFLIPASLSLGTHTFKFIYEGKRLVTRTLEIVPIPFISHITHKAAASGTVVTILGNNLDAVTGVMVGNTNASFSVQGAESLTFEFPDGASTDFVNLVSAARTVTSSSVIVACTAEPGDLLCLPVINVNGSFEEGSTGTAGGGGVGVPGWNLTGGSTSAGASFTAEITTETAYDGFQSAKLTINSISTTTPPNGGNSWHIQPTSNMTVIPGATYQLSLMIKGSGLSSVKFAVDEAGTPGYSEFQAPTIEVSTDNEWEEVTYEFKPASEGNGGDNVVRLAISMNYNGNTGGVLYLDNLRVVQIE